MSYTLYHKDWPWVHWTDDASNRACKPTKRPSHYTVVALEHSLLLSDGPLRRLRDVQRLSTPAPELSRPFLRGGRNEVLGKILPTPARSLLAHLARHLHL